MPSFVVNSSFEEVADMAMQSTSQDVVQCFEYFRWDAVEAFSLFQFVYGAFDFRKSNRVVNRRHAWLLFKEVQDGTVYWSMVVKHFVEVPRDGNVFHPGW